MADLRRLSPDDRPAVDAFLEKHRASSMFLRANLFTSGIEDGPDRFHGLYIGAFDGNVVTDVGAHYWNDNIILQAPNVPVELAQALAKTSGRPISGIIGPWDQVKAAEPELDLDRSRLGKVVPEFLYALDLTAMTVPESLTLGEVSYRRAEERDLTTLVQWRRQYDLHTMGYAEHAIDDTANEEMLAGMIDDKRLWVLEGAGEKENHLVAMTGFNAALPDVVQVGGVFTPEDQRGRGYGRAVVAGSLLDAKAEGVAETILFTETDNYSAQKAYESLGFVRIGDYGMVVLDPS